MRVLASLVVLLTGMIVVPVQAFSPDHARTVYSSVSFSKSSPWQEQGDYVFFDICLSEKNASSIDADKEELSALLDALTKYVASEKTDTVNSPFNSVLTSWLVPEVSFNFQNVQSSVVKEFSADGMTHKIFAMDAKALHEIKAEYVKSTDVGEWGKADWVHALQQARKCFKTKSEQQKFYELLGCPIVGFILLNGIFDMTKCDENSECVKELKEFLEWSPSDGSVFRKYPFLLWRTYADGKSKFFPNWKNDDGGAFKEAEQLYRQGRNVERIIELLTDSIRVNPINAKKWEYLGGVLKVQKKYDDALFSYVQSLLLDTNSIWAWKGLKECCQKTGMTDNEKGLEWYLLMNQITK